jgi:hypothetical protein
MGYCYFFKLPKEKIALNAKIRPILSPCLLPIFLQNKKFQ